MELNSALTKINMITEVKVAGPNKACKHKRAAGTSRNYC
jgi:hypothetical protein